MFSYEMPTKLFFGKDCIRDAGDVLADLGKKALLVTGRHSAKANGAQLAVTNKLDSLGIAWTLFDQVESNPSIDTVRKAAVQGKAEGVDFVIGIGGGSPMDASKVIALLCTNEIDDTQLFTGPYVKPLPIVTVPTTSGTGSEVTRVAVLTNPHVGTKQSVNHPYIFPTLSFADASFTMGVNATVTIDTAIDALSHAVEGYMSKKATPISDVWAEEAMRFLSPHLTELGNDLSFAVREDLMYGSTLAGIVIAQTGTTMVHGMGYQLTYYKGYSHGRANGILFPHYMQLMSETQPDKVEKVFEILGLAGQEDFAGLIQSLMPDTIDLTAEEIAAYTKLAMPMGSIQSTSYDLTPEIIAGIYKNLK